mgnify:CR=1 FL=1
MKHTTDELLLAYHLRTLAVELREEAAIKYAALNHDGALVGRADFKKTHPLVGFYEAALIELQGITDEYLRR